MSALEEEALRRLVQRQKDLWPEHSAFLEGSLAGRAPLVMKASESLARAILQLVQELPGGLDAFCGDYRFLCQEILLPEEIHFRRHGRYRLSRFEEANAECYANAPFMARYMNGLLLSNVFWSNHAHAFSYFVHQYLNLLPPGTSHLEIGPGHGLLLHFAAEHDAIRSVTGSDVSPTSIAKTRLALKTLGGRLQPDLMIQDVQAGGVIGNGRRFGSVVMSEILEHLEDPIDALRAVTACLEPGGFMFINVPANSPAPDHLYLFTDPEHAASVVRQAGLKVLDSQAFPISGATLASARKHKLAVSCVIVAQRID